MKAKIFVLLILCFAALSLPAQNKKFFPGYVINLEGDSLPGIVQLNNEQKWLAWKNGKGGDRIMFYPGDMQRFGVGGVDYVCETVEVIRRKFPERVHAWLQMKVDGIVDLAEYSGETLLGEKEVKNYFLRAGDSTLFFRVPHKPKQFAKQMGDYFGANEEISQQILDGELLFADLPRIVILFNAWAEENWQ